MVSANVGLERDFKLEILKEVYSYFKSVWCCVEELQCQIPDDQLLQELAS